MIFSWIFVCATTRPCSSPPEGTGPAVSWRAKPTGLYRTMLRGDLFSLFLISQRLIRDD